MEVSYGNLLEYRAEIRLHLHSGAMLQGVVDTPLDLSQPYVRLITEFCEYVIPTDSIEYAALESETESLLDVGPGDV